MLIEVSPLCPTHYTHMRFFVSNSPGRRKGFMLARYGKVDTYNAQGTEATYIVLS